MTALCSPSMPSSQTRPGRKIPGSLPCPPLTLSDSGYFSTDVSPRKPFYSNPLSKASVYGLLPLLDGQGSSEDSHSSENSGRSSPPSTADNGSLSSRKRKAATLPRASARPRPALPRHFAGGDSPSTRPDAYATPSHPRSSSLRLPDRFVPFRDNSRPAAELFQTTKPVDRLSPPEKLLRHGDASPDAFVPHRRGSSPMRARTISRSDSTAGHTGGFRPPTSVPSATGSSERQVSFGTVWAVGGVAPSDAAVDNGRGQLVQSRTNALLFRSSFFVPRPSEDEDSDMHEARLATALELDRAQRVLGFNPHASPTSRRRGILDTPLHKTYWNGSQWAREEPIPRSPEAAKKRVLPTTPFKVLDAPNLRNDFYCSLLAYSPNSHTLAVGLGNKVYGWSPGGGSKLLSAGDNDNAWLTSIAFSSTLGCKCILSIGRSNYKLALMSIYDGDQNGGGSVIRPRFEFSQPAPVSCLSWKPTCTLRPSRNPLETCGSLVKTEELLVGDHAGQLWYYSVEWPERWEIDSDNWRGGIVLLAVISVHTQQICGLAWSSSGAQFASGGNDNLCYLFDTAQVNDRWERAARSLRRSERASSGSHDSGSSGPMTAPRAVELKPGDERHRWVHGAAVKAIAFCPWQDGLVATGGGSHDKCIHFFHSTTGTALATIAVSAQVTSLIWSTTRREIVATFGYTQPEHSYRIAVFSWPECYQIAAIPWEGDHRALYAISYPMRPSDPPDGPGAGRMGGHYGRSSPEGCVVVASSDKTVKFHEVWPPCRKPTVGGISMLGGSDILEDIEGIDKEGDVIR